MPDCLSMLVIIALLASFALQVSGGGRSPTTAPTFESLQSQLTRTGYELHSVARSMLKLDPDRAKGVLLSSEIFRQDNPELVHVIWAFEDCRVTIPSEVLLPMMQALRAQSAREDQKYDRRRAYEFALLALARSSPEDAKPFVEESLPSENSIERRGAAAARAIMAGVEDAREFVARRLFVEDGTGAIQYRFDTLTPEQKNYYLSFEVDMQVCNGGFSQLFYNSSGQHSAQMPAALEAVGAKRAAELMREALRVTGLDGSEDQLVRLRTTEKPHVVEALGRLDKAYYDKREDVLMLLKLYAADHPEHFR